MKLAFITPTAYLDKFSKQGDFYLALAHLIDDNGKNEYARFHRREAERGREIILDNGLFEGAQVEPKALIRRARLIRAQTVCAPDVLYDSRGTIKEFKRFIRLKEEEGLVAKVMGIPQAQSESGWWECFQYMQLESNCDIIGLSILSIPKSFRKTTKTPITSSRMYLIQQLHSFQSVLGHRIKPCHLLGLGESYADIHTAKRLLPNTIISNDSSSAFLHGSKGVRYKRLGGIPGGKIREKINFNLEKLDSKTLEDIQYNINIARRIARDN